METVSDALKDGGTVFVQQTVETLLNCAKNYHEKSLTSQYFKKKDFGASAKKYFDPLRMTKKRLYSCILST